MDENKRRVDRATTALSDYLDEEKPATAVRDLLIDLMHFADANGINFHFELEQAIDHHESELVVAA